MDRTSQKTQISRQLSGGLGNIFSLAARSCCCVHLLFLSLFFSVSVVHAAPTEIEAALKLAFDSRIGNEAQFRQHLQVLNEYQGELTPAQRHQRTYLNAISHYRIGDISVAAELYQQLIEQDESLEFQYRALISLANLYAVRGNSEGAFRYALKVMDAKYQVLDPVVRQHAFVVLAYIYLKSGLLDETAAVLEQVNVEIAPKEFCFAAGVRLQLAYFRGLLSADSDAERDARIYCRESGELIIAMLMDGYVARNLMELGHGQAAQEILKRGATDVDALNYSNLTSVWYALLSSLAVERGDVSEAIRYGEIALKHSIAGSYSDADVMANKALADAYFQAQDFLRMRYYLQQHHDAYVKKVDEQRTAAIAYYSVKLQIEQKQSQLDALNEQVDTLELQKQLSEIELENRSLYMLMLGAILILGVAWAYRIRREKRSLTEQVQNDSLTGLYSRRHTTTMMERTLRLFSAMEADVGFVLLDLDRFKQINDVYGHQTGDWALQVAADALRHCSRKGDILGRLGGEEFGILLPGCDLESTRLVAEKCRKALAEIDTSNRGGFLLTGSFGVTTAERSGYSFSKLFSEADKALYSAKEKGRNRVVCTEALAV